MLQANCMNTRAGAQPARGIQMQPHAATPTATAATPENVPGQRPFAASRYEDPAVSRSLGETGELNRRQVVSWVVSTGEAAG